MAVRVARAGAHDGDARLHLLDERVGGRRAAAVMRDLQQVQATAVAPDAGRQQLWVDLFLDVAGEDHPPRSEVNVENDRYVVDAGS